MTPEEVGLVAVLIARLKAERGFAPAFYARLLTAAPETEVMFGDIAAQELKLTEELDALAALLGDLGDLEQRATALGRRHRTYGVRAAHYEIARRCMQDAIEDVAGGDLDAATRAAWARAYN